LPVAPPHAAIPVDVCYSASQDKVIAANTALLSEAVIADVPETGNTYTTARPWQFATSNYMGHRKRVPALFSARYYTALDGTICWRHVFDTYPPISNYIETF